jgi:hypothetical protein
VTALAAPARYQPVAWHKLAWVTWRQHRAALAGLAAILAALSLYLLVYGLKINHAYAAVLASCHPARPAGCHDAQADAFKQQYWGGGSSLLQNGGAQTISGLLQAVPVLLGVFAGAPILARELETGTFRFAFTQGCGRLRWTITKLVLMAAVLTTGAAAFSQLFSWYYHPFLAQGITTEFLPVLFNLRGVDFAAWALIAFAISACAGAAIRRTVPAMAVSLVVWIVLAVGTMLVLRPHYEAPLTATGIPGPTAWVLSGVIGGLHAQEAFSYQPQSRFWTFQFIEGGWLLVLALLLGAATIWLVRRRAA